MKFGRTVSVLHWRSRKLTFDSEAQAIVHGSVDALPEQGRTTFDASQGMAVFDNETRSY